MLLSSSNRKYPPFPLLSYFSVVVCLRCLLHHILLLIACTFRENREFVFIIIVQFMMSANNRVPLVFKIVFVCLCITPSQYHHCANLSEDIELIKCLSHIFCRVCIMDNWENMPYLNWRPFVFSVSISFAFFLSLFFALSVSPPVFPYASSSVSLPISPCLSPSASLPMPACPFSLPPSHSFILSLFLSLIIKT